MKDIQSYILDDTIQWVAPADLSPATENPRVRIKTAHPEAFAALKESIRRGFFAPILVEKSTGEIVAGHQRVDAALELKIATVPVLYLKDLSQEEKTRIRIADNGTFGAWDLPHLTMQLDMLPKDDLPLLGLDAPTLDLVAPTDYDNQTTTDSGEAPPAFETLTFKLPKEAAEIVQGIIEGLCRSEKCKPPTALERTMVEWSQDPSNTTA
ncbi:MAG: ParB N-terminal domain-containing protein [Acidobacteriota bacterium]